MTYDHIDKEQISIILIGNKIDKIEERQVSTEQGQEFAEQNNFMFMETSAKENKEQVIDRVFFLIIKDIANRLKIEIRKKDDFKIQKNSVEKIEKSKKGCC